MRNCVYPFALWLMPSTNCSSCSYCYRIHLLTTTLDFWMTAATTHNTEHSNSSCYGKHRFLWQPHPLSIWWSHINCIFSSSTRWRKRLLSIHLGELTRHTISTFFRLCYYHTKNNTCSCRTWLTKRIDLSFKTLAIQFSLFVVVTWSIHNNKINSNFKSRFRANLISSLVCVVDVSLLSAPCSYSNT